MNPTALMIALLCGGAPAVDFDTQVVPVLTRAGCNTGACHGSAAGRGGFRLSLFGSDPRRDHDALAREAEGRRLRRSSPDDSLLLAKPTGQIDHGGGFRFDAESESAGLIRQWIAQGARRLERRRLVSWRAWLSGPDKPSLGERIAFRAEARFDDGSVEDVTRWTLFTPADPQSIVLSDDGSSATVARRGQHVVVARYLDQVQAIRRLVPPREGPLDETHFIERNFVDRRVNAMLRAANVAPGPPASAGQWARRVYLDLTGRLPTPEQTEAFLADDAPHARDRLIDQLLASEAMVDYWTMRFADWFRVRAEPNSHDSGWAYYRWLRRQVQQGVPYDEMARALVTAEGDTHLEGPPNFLRVAGDARATAEFVSELFLGARLRCANCHDHPLDRWTQDDYHGLAAIFAQVERGRVISDRASGEVSHPATGEPARRRIPGGPYLNDNQPGRATLAEWLTSASNRQFAEAIVNRLWSAMMGRGLVEPVDDLRATNPASHPELLTDLADDFVSHGYDFRHVLRRIAQSAAYQRASASASTAEQHPAASFYAFASARSLDAAVYADAVADVTGAPLEVDLPSGAPRAVRLPFPEVAPRPLQVLGRCPRDGSADAGESPLAKRLYLLNGPFLNERLGAAGGRLRTMLDAGHDDRAIVEQFYLRALCRPPRESESRLWRKALSTDAAQRREVLEDFLWSLLTCQEFATNH